LVVSAAVVEVVPAADVDVAAPDSVVVVVSTVDPVVSEPPEQPVATSAKAHKTTRLFTVETVGDRVLTRNK
jgi:hypothetical protein